MHIRGLKTWLQLTTERPIGTFKMSGEIFKQTDRILKKRERGQICRKISERRRERERERECVCHRVQEKNRKTDRKRERWLFPIVQYVK